MAYLSPWSRFPATTLLGEASVQPSARNAIRLSRTERDVIILSRHDSRSSLRAPGLLRRGASRLFGLSTTNVLADPRLEALRRFAVTLRYDDHRFAWEEELGMLANGYGIDEITEARVLVGREVRQPRRSARQITAGMLMLALAGLFGGWLFATVNGLIDDQAIAVVVVGIAMLSVTAMLFRQAAPIEQLRMRTA